MRLPGSLRWIALALLGLVIASAVALAASHLASQQIGIASESVSAGDSLAPPVTSVGRKPQEGKGANGPGKPAETTGSEGSAGGSEPEPSPEGGETEAPVEPTETTEPESTAGPPTSSKDDGGGRGGGGGGDD